jgi:formylmethanofuran dehydrogenase subunit E
MISLLWVHGSAESVKPSMDEDTINCSRCEDPTPESEVLEVGAWWLCGICYDDI